LHEGRVRQPSLRKVSTLQRLLRVRSKAIRTGARGDPGRFAHPCRGGDSGPRTRSRTSDPWTRPGSRSHAPSRRPRSCRSVGQPWASTEGHRELYALVARVTSTSKASLARRGKCARSRWPAL
jgi:hypothetical protein